MTGQLNGQTKTYASSLLYAPHGPVESLSVGGLWEQTCFNARPQTTVIRVGVASIGSKNLALDPQNNTMVEHRAYDVSSYEKSKIDSRNAAQNGGVNKGENCGQQVHKVQNQKVSRHHPVRLQRMRVSGIGCSLYVSVRSEICNKKQNQPCALSASHTPSFAYDSTWERNRRIVIASMNPKQPPAAMSAGPWESELTSRLAQQFGARISEFLMYLGQNFLIAAPDAAIELLEFLKVDEDFDYLVDLTAVDYPERENRFELIYTLYSFASNERIRVKTRVSEGQKPQTATGVYPSANWLEREVFDMFGIDFAGHPDMRRMLLPDDWRGHPLRKDYGILQMDNQWVKDNLGIESGQ